MLTSFKKNLYKNIALSAFVALIVSTPALAYTDRDITGNLLADVSPRNPAPNEVYTVTLTSYATDLNRAMIEWKENGVTMKARTGMKSYSGIMPHAGSSLSLSVTVRAQNGASFEKQLEFRPAAVALMWQAASYRPDYYPGRAQPTAGSSILLSAEPIFVDASGTNIPATNLVYEWSRRGKPDQSGSGYGRSTYVLDSLSEYNNETVSVEVSTVDTKMIASSGIKIPTKNPRLVIYEEDPLQGTLFSRAISDTFALSREEIVLRGEPYFYPRGSANSLKLAWSVNSAETVTDPSNPTLLTLREQSNSKGTASISFSADSSKNSFRNLTQSFILEFGKNTVQF